MKQSEVQIGATLFTRIGEELAPVVVASSKQNYKGKTIFLVHRPGKTQMLDRSAAALRTENRKFF